MNLRNLSPRFGVLASQCKVDRQQRTREGKARVQIKSLSKPDRRVLVSLRCEVGIADRGVQARRCRTDRDGLLRLGYTLLGAPKRHEKERSVGMSGDALGIEFRRLG